MTWRRTMSGNGTFSSLFRDDSIEDVESWWFLPYDQLNLAFFEGKKSYGIILIESEEQGKRRPYHKQKLSFLLSNLRHFALEAQAADIPVLHLTTTTQYDDALRGIIQEIGSINMFKPAERELRVTLKPLIDEGSITVHEHPGWLTPQEWFTSTVGTEPPFRMDRFYRNVRKKTGWLMEDDAPYGGKFSHDGDNRHPWKGEHTPPQAPVYKVDSIDEEVISLVNSIYAEHPGDARLDHLPTSSSDHEQALEFTTSILEHFGQYEDAMTKQSRGLFHSRLASSMNLHRIMPQHVVNLVLAADIPLNSKEGFLRQMIWREYVHHIHDITDGFRTIDVKKTKPKNRQANWTSASSSDEESHPNHLNQTRSLPMAYWGEKSGLDCLDWAVESVMDEAWTHHIPRLMVLSNLAQLLDIEPRELTDWFHAGFVDAFDWVVEPNVLGMGTFSLGDAMMTKPYISGTPYIKKMGDFCSSCQFHPTKTCPISSMYWAYFERHKASFKGNHRLAMTLRTLEKRDPEKKRNDAETFAWVSTTLSEGKSLQQQTRLFN